MENSSSDRNVSSAEVANSHHFFDPRLETLSRNELQARQQILLSSMLETVFERNLFYRRKFQQAGWRTTPRIEEWAQFPLTTKAELVADAAAVSPYGSNLTYPLGDYIRLHQTSGTTGRPLAVLDTRESWEEWMDCWSVVLRAAGVIAGDCVFVAFSFGPFIGFWAGFEAALRLGCRALSGGGQNSVQRLISIDEHQANVLVCTPSYAIHLAEVARKRGIDLSSSSVRVMIHAGEPGASIPATRARIEESWGAKCFDHVGASEIGAYGFQCHAQAGAVHINELSFICECIDPATLQPVQSGGMGELVVTNLKRWGFPAIRYRTGDLVRLSEPQPCSCGRSFRVLIGGILGRTDDMVTIRGVNIFPSSIEAVLRRFKEVVEFEGRIFREQGLDQLQLRVELTMAGAEALRFTQRLKEELRNALGLRIQTELAAPGSLPRYEMKAKRFKRVDGSGF